MTICYLALGSNLNNPQKQLRLALHSLRKTPRLDLLKVAPLYFNKAFGKKAQPNFYNTVVAITTTLPPQCLLKKCLQIEKAQGRQRKLRWGARTLDIDLIFYGDKMINKPTLIIPHPRYQKRDFVLVPLSQLGRFSKSKFTQ